jgi:hypothetical protein
MPEDLQPAHVGHLQAKDQKDRQRKLQAVALQISDSVLSIRNHFEGIMDAAFLMKAPKHKEGVRVVGSQQNWT